VIDGILPDPVIGAIVAGGLAALGYLGRLLVEAWRDWRSRRAERLARLLELQALLRASKVAFVIQRQLAGRLADGLRAEHPTDLPGDPGLERMFSHLYDSFSANDRDLHAVIRGYTVSALHSVNTEMAAWLKSDTSFKTATGNSDDPAGLAEQLHRLEAHLLLWLAKYDAWIPDRPDHALVYLADEERQGLGFQLAIRDRFQPLYHDLHPRARQLLSTRRSTHELCGPDP
jgi:hypothetical protein